jgi:hypothetical protein
VSSGNDCDIRVKSLAQAAFAVSSKMAILFGCAVLALLAMILFEVMRPASTAMGQRHRDRVARDRVVGEIRALVRSRQASPNGAADRPPSARTGRSRCGRQAKSVSVTKK